MSQNRDERSNIVRRELACGPILVEIKDGLLQARGIRYANAGRFETPRRPEPWTETSDCTKPGHVSPQLPSRLSVVIGDVLTDRTQSEDCFFLSVTAPATTTSSESSEKLPVMFWIHGGAYMSGGGDLEPYDPSGLAHRGVVVVRINYRLGIFGTQAIPGITEGNLGLQDQIMALQWVQENIAYLGGDPTNVTIFGQSAGADSCFNLLVADGAASLFQRAILQSNVWTSWTDRSQLNQTLTPLASQALDGKATTLSTEELLEIQSQLAQKGASLPHGALTFAPYLGVYPMPQQSDLASRLEQAARTKPIITGWTKEDALPFVKANAFAQRLASIPFLGPWFLRLITHFATQKVFANGSRKLSEIWLRENGQCTTFTFDYSPKGNAWQASHCIDIAFILGRWQYWKTTPVMKGIDQAAYDRLGDAMKDSWVAFAKGAKLPNSHVHVDGTFSGI